MASKGKQAEHLFRAKGQEPILKFHSVGGIIDSLWRNERISAFDAFGFLTAVGTSRGRAHVFDGEGNILMTSPSLHVGLIVCILVRPDFVVSAGEDSRIVVWDWKTGRREQYGDSLPGAAGNISGLAVSPGFPSKSGVLYFSISNGAVVRRMKTIFGFADHSIMSEVDLKVLEGFESVLLDDAFDVDIPQSSGVSSPQSSRSITTLPNCLYYHSPFLVCVGNLGVHVFSEESNRVVASFSWLLDRDARQGILDRDCDCHVSDGELIVRVGRSVYLCHYSEDNPPSVTKAFEASDDVYAVTIIERHIIVLFSGSKVLPAKPKGDFELSGVLSPGVSRHKGYSFSIAKMEAVPAGEVKVDVHTKDGVVPLSMTVPRPVGSDGNILPISGVVPVVEKEKVEVNDATASGLEEIQEEVPETISKVSKAKTSTEEIMPCLAVYSMDPVEIVDYVRLAMPTSDMILFPFVIHSSAPFSQSRYHVTSQTQPYPLESYLAGPNGVFGIRALKNGERVKWLVDHHEYSKALFVCERHKCKEEQLEVADMFGSHLWEHGNHARAVQVWAEYILPYAPVEYWRILCERLGSEVFLMDAYLPFDNPSVLPSTAYLDVLVHFVKEHDYRGFYERISRWPVCYPVDKLEEAIKAEVDTITRQGQRDMTPLKSLPLPTSKPDQLRVSDTFGDMPSRRAVSVAIARPEKHSASSHERERARFADALRVLLKIRSPAALEYFRAHDVGVFFNLSKSVLDESEQSDRKGDQNAGISLKKAPQSPLTRLSTESMTGKVHSGVPLHDQREILQELLFVDSKKVLDILVEERQIIGVHDICTLLQPNHKHRLEYLRLLSNVDPDSVKTYHSDMIATYVRLIKDQGQADQKDWNSITDGEMEEYRSEMLTLLKTSEYYDLERVHEVCSSYEVAGALEIVEQRMSDSESK